MPINFPASPNANDTHTDSSGIVWTFDGTSWGAANSTSSDVRSFWPAAEMQPSLSTNAVATIGSSALVPAGSFRDNAVDQWYVTTKCPPSWVGSSINLSVLLSTGATSGGGNVRLQGVLAEYDINEAPPSQTASSQAEAACPATAHQIFEVSLLTGFAVSKEFVSARVLRWGDHANDTLNAALYIIGVRLSVNP